MTVAEPRLSALGRLRAATGAMHAHLDKSLDAVERLADPAQRGDLIGRFAAFHFPAEAALSTTLDAMSALDFQGRSRARSALGPALDASWPQFPCPRTRAEALGLYYVVEGATLGGHVILRELAKRGVTDETLRFLDPYGADTGRRWRQFVDVLESESLDETGLLEAETGALRGFAHAERVLCGSDR